MLSNPGRQVILREFAGCRSFHYANAVFLCRHDVKTIVNEKRSHTDKRDALIAVNEWVISDQSPRVCSGQLRRFWITVVR